jgi:hypothetical protein
VTGRDVPVCARCRRVAPADVVDVGDRYGGEVVVCGGCLTTAEQVEHPPVDGSDPTIPTGWDTP